MGAPRRRETREADAADLERRLQRAISDVLDGTVTFETALRSRKVPHERLRAALHVAGWQPRTTPGPRRRSFGRGGRRE